MYIYTQRYKTMTQFHITLVDSHDCTVAADWTMSAIDKADAEVQLLDEFGPDAAWLEVQEIVHVDEL